MKVKWTKTFLIIILVALSAVRVMAQEEDTTYIFDPSTLQPAQDGYFIAGKDVIIDGQEVHKNGCEDYYGDSDHHESGTQQGFTYGNAMIMPTCEGKSSEEEWPEGYIQLTKYKYPDTDSTVFGYIITPELHDLKSLRVLVGTDLSLHGRDIYMIVESSLDGGETWDVGAFLTYQVVNQGGDNVYYEAGGDSPGFDAMAEDSQTGPVLLRIATVPPPGEDKGERLKIFGIEIVASKEGNGGVTSVDDKLIDRAFFEISNHMFIANKGNIHVYKITGAKIGYGRKVNIPGHGLYVVKSDQGVAKKVFIR